MFDVDRLFENNRRWADELKREDPEYFLRLSKQQTPKLLWIGCSDSRVPANQILGLAPGEVFVHRNVANIVLTSDLNCMSVAQFAIEVLEVEHIIVCGHYGCGGVRAALDDRAHGLIDYWIWSIKDINKRYERILGPLAPDRRHDALCELNVIAQVLSLAHTKAVRDRWERTDRLAIHGWIYRLEDGLLQDLGVRMGSGAPADETFAAAVQSLKARWA